MKFLFVVGFLICIAGCVNSYSHVQNRKDAVEVNIDGRIIRVIDHGEKVEMVRKGYFHGGDTISHWEDYIKAGEIATGCKITHVTSKVPDQPDHGWKEGLKDCSK